MQVSLSWKQNHISDFPVLVAHFWPAIKLGSCELPQKIMRLAKYTFIIINRFFSFVIQGYHLPTKNKTSDTII